MGTFRCVNLIIVEIYLGKCLFTFLKLPKPFQQKTSNILEGFGYQPCRQCSERVRRTYPRDITAEASSNPVRVSTGTLHLR